MGKRDEPIFKLSLVFLFDTSTCSSKMFTFAGANNSASSSAVRQRQDEFDSEGVVSVVCDAVPSLRNHDVSSHLQRLLVLR